MYKVTENPKASEWTFPLGSDAFIVVDENGSVQGGTFATTEQAQKRADVLNDPDAPTVHDLFFDEDTAIDYFGNRGETTIHDEIEDNTPPSEKTSFVTSEQYQVGDIIQDGKYRYSALEDSHYQVAGEDFPETGYWTLARLVQ